jgi:hypothetical protein
MSHFFGGLAMSTYSTASSLRVWAFRAVLAAIVAVLCTAATMAQSAANIVRVEQDWELVVGTPNPDHVTPQIVCVISPFGNVQSLYAAFELNQRSHAQFTSGGMQLQVWNGEETLTEQTSESTAVLDTPNETITWTQKMALVDGTVVFAVTDGQSTTWGNFGFGGENMVLTADSSLTDLNAYDTAVSLANSGAGYGVNHVKRLVIKEVRLFTDTGEQTTDTTEKVIYNHD